MIKSTPICKYLKNRRKKFTDEQTEQNEQNIINKENIVKKREGIRRAEDGQQIVLFGLERKVPRKQERVKLGTIKRLERRQRNKERRKKRNNEQHSVFG